MRTKTLLLTAVLGVGAATAYGQVYSINTVGYVNSELKPGFNLIANPLDNKSGNTVENLFGTAMPEGTTIYKFVNGGYEPSNGITFGAWDNGAQTLMPGEGAFVYIPTDAAATMVTFVGDVMQGSLVTDLIAGFNMVSSKVPQAGLLSTDLEYTAEEGDTVYQHTRGAGYKPTVSVTFGAWDPAEPTIEVGEAFWLYKEAAGQWTREFTVK